MSLDGGRAISTRRPTCGAYAEGTPSRATLVSELFAGSCDSPPVARRPAPQRMGCLHHHGPGLKLRWHAPASRMPSGAREGGHASALR